MPKVIEDEMVYQAVMRVVSERGYAGATTKQMADAARISEVTLFRKYGSKVQLVKQAISSIVEQSDFKSAAHYTGDLAADLTRVIAAYQAAAVQHGLFFSALISEISRYPALTDSFDEPLSIFQSIAQLIARYQEEGELRQENPLHAVAALLGPLMYVAMMRSGMPNESLEPVNLISHVAFFLKGRSNKKRGK